MGLYDLGITPGSIWYKIQATRRNVVMLIIKDTRMTDLIDLLSDDDNDNAVNRKLLPTFDWTCPRYTVINGR